MATTIFKEFYGLDCIIRHDYELKDISKKIQSYQDESVKAFLHFMTNVPKHKSFKSLLDVGCGDSYCIDQFKAKGFTDVIGIDLYVDPLLEKSNTDIKVSDWYTMSEDVFANKKFDAIFINHSLEHAANVYKLMQQVSRLQDAGSALFVAVPDGNSPFGYAITSSTTHFSCITEGYLRTTLQRFGYNVEIERKEFRPGAPELWAYAIKQYDGFK